MVEKKPTDLKSVTLGQVNKLEDKLVVGGASTESASSADRDLAKLGKIETKIERDTSGPSSGKRQKDSEGAKKDADKRVEQGLPPYKIA